MAADYGDREMILANFQAVTGNDDINECIETLNCHNWDLTLSVNSYFANLSANEVNSGVQISQSIPAISRESCSVQTYPGRKLSFNIKYKDRNILVTVDDWKTVDILKKEIEIQLGVPKSSQCLSEWPTQTTVSDDTILASLNLGDETSLILSPSLNGTTSLSEVSDSKPCSSSVRNGRIARSCSKGNCDTRLIVQYLNTKHHITLPGDKTVLDVKSRLNELTNIDIQKQMWSGWPVPVDDKTRLRDINLDQPHSLIVKQRESGYPPPEKVIARPVINVDSDNEEDSMEMCSSDDAVEIEDDDDLIATDFPSRKLIRELMPDSCTDNIDTLTTFTNNFEERYGHCHPHFFLGSLHDALEEANGKIAKDRWPLLVYLHNDASILTNVFCSQILCDENVVSFISQNFMSWAWDMTHDTNRTLLLDVVTQKCGSIAAETVRDFKSEQYPLVLVVMKNRSALEVSAVLQGRISLDEFMTSLMNAREVFEQAKLMDIREENEREERELMRREQDEAYQESLRADRAKQEEKDRQENEALRVKQETEEKALLEAQTKQAQIMSLEDQLPDEPGADCPEPISNLRFRMPNNENFTRKFLASSPLKVVLTFVQSKGYLEDQYSVVTNFPRKQLSSMDSNKSLEDLGLYPQVTLFVEEI